VLYGGNVLGKFEELVPEKKIQQSWRLKNWSSGHFSNVVIELEETVSYHDNGKQSLSGLGLFPKSIYPKAIQDQ